LVKLFFSFCSTNQLVGKLAGVPGLFTWATVIDGVTQREVMCPWKTSHLEIRDGEEAMYSDIIAEISRRYVWVEPFSMFVRSIVPPVHVVGV
jgi:hypothetical protein